jgi:hypothetical protein
MGFLSKDFKTGASLGKDPWFRVIAVIAYAGAMCSSRWMRRLRSYWVV